MHIPSVKLYKSLYPLMWIYKGITTFRNKLFDCNILQSKSFHLPIICIGNLSVGGTGKTPHTEYIVNLLKDNYNVAVLSRGYKRKTKGYVLATADSNANTIGDEPYQIKSKFPDIIVAVDEKRCHGIEEILNNSTAKTDVIVLDDAYQHRYVKAGLYLLLTDYNRLFCKDEVLPVGRLREDATGMKRAHIVIVTKCPATLSAKECDYIANELNLLPHQELYFSKFKYDHLRPLFTQQQVDMDKSLMSHEELKDREVLILTGIASPTPLINMIESYAKKVDTLSFSDHHHFTANEMVIIKEQFEKLDASNRLIITTEKDATRLASHPDLMETIKPYIYIQPIVIEILNNKQEIFNHHIIDYVREN